MDAQHTDPAQQQGRRVARGAKRHGARYKARRRAVDILFEAEVKDVDPVEIVNERVTLSRDPEMGVSPIADYTKEIVSGVAVELNTIDGVLENYLTQDWELYRIAGVDRAILRVVAWELLFNPEVPPQVAAVEATELASQYSDDAAPSYINAMMDRMAKNLDDIRASMAVIAHDESDAEEEFAFPAVDSNNADAATSDSSDDEQPVYEQVEQPEEAADQQHES